MLAENEKLNLTAIRDLDEARVLHSLDSLAIEALQLTPQHCIDLGTGNGFPGVALRALYPQATVLLIDRTGKKIDAVRRALLAAGLDDVGALQADATHIPATHPELCGRFDLITARAVGRPRGVGELAKALARSGGNLVLWIDRNTEPPQQIPGFELKTVHTYELPEPANRQRRLARYRRH